MDTDIIRKTKDGGIHWDTIYSNVSMQYYSVSFITPQVGFAVGNTVTSSSSGNPGSVRHYGAVFSTNDFGKTWSQLSVTAQNPFRCVWFNKKGKGYLVNDNFIMCTVDSGKIWTNFASPDTSTIGLYSAWQISTGTIFLAGGSLYTHAQIAEVTCDEVADTASVISNNTTGVFTKNYTANASIHPNPNNGLFTLNFKESQDSFVKIFNAQGLEIKELFIQDKEFTIDLQNKPQGIYYINITTGNNSSSYKIIKE